MWIQFSAIRQALSIAIFINSITYLHDKRSPVKFIGLNLIGGLFHTSAFLTLPAVLFSFKKIKKSNIVSIIIFILFFGILLFGEKLMPQLIEITTFFTGDRYLSRFNVETEVSTTIIGSIFWALQLSIVLFYARKQPESRKLLFYFCSLSYLIYVLSPLVWLSGRVGYYFFPFSMVVYPLIVQQEKNKLIKYGVAVFFIFAVLYNLTSSLTLDWVIEGYSEYQTIFAN
jgi:hypothetical protein